MARNFCFLQEDLCPEPNKFKLTMNKVLGARAPNPPNNVFVDFDLWNAVWDCRCLPNLSRRRPSLQVLCMYYVCDRMRSCHGQWDIIYYIYDVDKELRDKWMSIGFVIRFRLYQNLQHEYNHKMNECVYLMEIIVWYVVSKSCYVSFPYCALQILNRIFRCSRHLKNWYAAWGGDQFIYSISYAFWACTYLSPQLGWTAPFSCILTPLLIYGK